MCDPVTMTVMAVGQAGASYMSKKSAADQQEASQMVATQQERERAGRENTAIRARQSQQRDALAAEMEEGSRRANQARATAVISSAESGITGRAASLVEQDVNVQHARHNQALVEQRAENDFSSNMQIEESRMRNKSNLQQINKPIEQPSMLGLAMDVVSGVAGVQTQTANYTKMMGEAPSIGGFGKMLGIGSSTPSAPNSSMPALASAQSPMSSLPNYSQSASASGAFLPPI